MCIYINIVMDSTILFFEAVFLKHSDKELLSSLLQLYDYYNSISVIGWMDVLNGVACSTLHSILTQSGQITCHWKLSTIIETLICKLSSLGRTDPVQLDPWLLDWRNIVKIHDQTSRSGTLSSSVLQRHVLSALLAHNIFCLQAPK